MEVVITIAPFEAVSHAPKPETANREGKNM
jgi:hypothetical protein